MITQVELNTYKVHKDSYEKKRTAMKKVEAYLADMEEDLLTRLKAGEGVEVGIRIAQIETTMRKEGISWKDIVEELKGKAFVVETQQKARSKKFEKLVVLLVGNESEPEG